MSDGVLLSGLEPVATQHGEGIVAASCAFTTQPTTTAAGQTISTVRVAVKDAAGNTVTGDNTTDVTVAITGGTGTTGAHLTGAATVAAVAGVATFSGLAIDSVGTGYKLTATATGPTSATSTTFSITPGAASVDQSIVTEGSATVSISCTSTTTITLRAKDAFGNNLTTDGLTVEFTGAGGVPSSFTIAPSPATDNQIGTYPATFTGQLPDTVMIDATIGRVTVTRTPKPTITVTP